MCRDASDSRVAAVRANSRGFFTPWCDLNGEFNPARAPSIEDLDLSITTEQSRQGVQWLRRRGEPKALNRSPREGLKSLKRQGQVGSAFGVGDGVKLVHNHKLYPREGWTARGASEQDKQALGCCDQDVRRVADCVTTVALRRVTGADRVVNGNVVPLSAGQRAYPV